MAKKNPLSLQVSIDPDAPLAMVDKYPEPDVTQMGDGSLRPRPNVESTAETVRTAGEVASQSRAPSIPESVVGFFEREIGIRLPTAADVQSSMWTGRPAITPSLPLQVLNAPSRIGGRLVERESRAAGISPVVSAKLAKGGEAAGLALQVGAGGFAVGREVGKAAASAKVTAEIRAAFKSVADEIGTQFKSVAGMSDSVRQGFVDAFDANAARNLAKKEREWAAMPDQAEAARLRLAHEAKVQSLRQQIETVVKAEAPATAGPRRRRPITQAVKDPREEQAVAQATTTLGRPLDAEEERAVRALWRGSRPRSERSEIR